MNALQDASHRHQDRSRNFELNRKTRSLHIGHHTKTGHKNRRTGGGGRRAPRNLLAIAMCALVIVDVSFVTDRGFEIIKHGFQPEC